MSVGATTGNGSGAMNAPRHIDYLAKDYESFREFMLQRLDTLAPEWTERHAADLGVAIVELLAYAGDLLSYRQDAFALEAYIDTAVRRISIARLARLLGYRLNNGCNARTLVEIWPTMGSLLQPAGTVFCTNLGGDLAATVSVEEFQAARGPDTVVFESMRDVRLVTGHNELGFDWIGPRSGQLRGRVDQLDVGDLLLITGTDARGEPVHHPVMIRQRQFNDQSTVVGWSEPDRIPGLVEALSGTDAALLRASANVVPVDHGETIVRDVAELERRDGYIVVPGPSITSSATAPLASTSAVDLLRVQDPQEAIPAIAIHGTNSNWLCVPDLLDVGRFARAFVAEIDNDGSAQLRFAPTKDPGHCDGEPRCAYRIGNGQTGNVAAGAISHIVADGFEGEVANRLRNHRPATGGQEPEPMDRIRLFAPMAHLSTEARCIIATDYDRSTSEVAGVDQVSTIFEAHGLRTLVRVVVQPHDDSDTRVVLDAVRNHLAPLRAIGHTLLVQPVGHLDVEIVCTVSLEQHTFAEPLEQKILGRLLGPELSADRTRGLLFENGLAIGESLSSSTLLQTLLDIEGVGLASVQLRTPPQVDDLDEARPRPDQVIRLAARSNGTRTITVHLQDMP